VPGAQGKKGGKKKKIAACNSSRGRGPVRSARKWHAREGKKKTGTHCERTFVIDVGEKEGEKKGGKKIRKIGHFPEKK